MAIILISFSIAIFVILNIAAIISLNEKDVFAAKRILISSLIIPLPFLLFGIIPFNYQFEAGLISLGLSIVFILIFIVPLGRNKKYKHTTPLNRIDERDTMFARNELKPGSENYKEYYKRNPEKKALDEKWRKEAGLLKPGSLQYDPFQFASADASFETIEALKHTAEGKVNPEITKTEINHISRYIKNWSNKLGAFNTGITELKDYHIYSVGGRAERYNKTYERKHRYAIAFTVEMAKEMMDSAPGGSTVMESGQQYLESGKIAIQLAKFIRNLGYEARAHIDGNYEVVCPLVELNLPFGR